MGFAIAVLVVFLIIWAIKGFWIALVVVVGAPIALLVGAMIYSSSDHAERERQKQNSKIEADKEALSKKYKELQAKAIVLADKHIDVLTRKYRAGIYVDEYGVERADDWIRSLDEFFGEIVSKQIDINGYVKLHSDVYGIHSLSQDSHQMSLESDLKRICMQIDSYVKSISNRSVIERSNKQTNPTAVGVDYEIECAGVLRANGWITQMTAKVGDQGVDIVAMKNSLKVAIQCKKYSTPVGNSAVQEVSAGRAHYQADYAAVVSDSGFTKAARELAISNGTLLLTASELPELENRLT